jgi:signal transduction histidine kinase
VVIVTDITPQRINEERIRRLRDEAVTANRELTASLRRLEETQQRLVATEKLASLATMSAGLAHEVNNPLGFVTSGVSCLRDWTAKLMRFVAAFRAGSTKSELDALLRDLALADVATEVEPILADVGVGLDRIKRIVSAFRDFVDGGAAPVEAVDLDTVVRDAVAEAAGTDPDVAVIATPGRTPPVAASSTVARILLDQLLENATFAVKAAGRPGSVSVTTTPRGDRVVLSVADTGVGMDAAVLSRAADPFFTTRAPGPHVGMGLTIAQAVVRRHGGELTLASQPGVGTTVEVSLPAWRDGLSAAEASAGPSSGAAGAAGRT